MTDEELRRAEQNNRIVGWCAVIFIVLSLVSRCIAEIVP